jgi:hypothetical protein
LELKINNENADGKSVFVAPLLQGSSWQLAEFRVLKERSSYSWKHESAITGSFLTFMLV